MINIITGALKNISTKKLADGLIPYAKKESKPTNTLIYDSFEEYLNKYKSN